MLGVFICKQCGLVQLKNPAKLKQQLKEMDCCYLECPKCGGMVTEADVSYARYTQLSQEERDALVERHRQENPSVRVLITGANGQLGHSLNKIIAKLNREGRNYQVFNTSRTAKMEDYPVTVLDITAEEDVNAAVREIHPNLIINCAAHTGVDLCETQQEEAYAMNTLGVKHLAEAAKRADAVFIQVSTDYVFDGDKEGAYLEEDETNPQSVYGRTKLDGEEVTKAVGGKYFIVRTAWLYGKGKNFVRTMLNLAKTKDRLTVVNDQRGTPTSTDELAKAIMFLSDRKEYGVYHATCEGSTTWYEFAKKIFEYTNTKIDVLPVSSDEYKTAAKRPKNSVLENQKLNALSDFRMKDWEEALKEYLVEELGY